MRILFYDKQIKYNCPNYALPLLENLNRNDNEIFVMLGGKNPNNPSEKITRLK